MYKILVVILLLGVVVAVRASFYSSKKCSYFVSFRQIVAAVLFEVQQTQRNPIDHWSNASFMRMILLWAW